MMDDDEKEPLHPTDAKIIEEAIDFLRRAEAAESDNRADALEAYRFRAGEQWPAQIQNSRQLEMRPCLVINKVDAYCTQVGNQQRQQRPRIKVEPTSGGATKKVADIIKGMIRHIETNRGGGDLAYDTAFNCAITGGVGYWRGMADYVSESSFEQELYLAPIDNPFSVYRDPNSTMPDGSDQEQNLITDVLSKRAFRQMYPDADDGASFNEQAIGDTGPNWVTPDEIRIAEYYKIRRTRDILIRMPDGSSAWKSHIPPDFWKKIEPSLGPDDRRESSRSVVCWYKLTAMEVIDKRELPGRYIPVFPVYGKVEIIDGKRKLSGLVKNAMDPQRMYNFWRTAMTETVALAPKAKWVIAEGQDEGHENEWATANTSARATLRYKPTDVNGTPAAPPQRLQPEPPPAGAMVMAESMGNDLTSVLGIVDPAMRIGGNVSGKALNSERMQSDNSNFHFYDNMTRTMRFTGVWLLDVFPTYYSEPGRVVRIVGDDGRSSQETINQQNPTPGKNTPGPVEQVLNDVTIGEYACVMDTGPGYNTKRQESLEVMAPMFERDPELMKIAGDVFFRALDFDGSETIADRMAAANPLAQIDEKSEIPPGVQMKLKQQEAQLQEAAKQMEALQAQLKYRMDVVQVQEEGQTKRTLIDATAKTHSNDADNVQWGKDIAVKAETARHDTAVKSQTALGVAEIRATGELLKTKVNNEHDLKRLDHESEENERQLAAEAAKPQGST